MGYSFELAARNLLYVPSHMTVHTNIFVIKVVKHWLERDTHFDLKQFTTHNTRNTNNVNVFSSPRIQTCHSLMERVTE